MIDNNNNREQYGIEEDEDVNILVVMSNWMSFYYGIMFGLTFWLIFPMFYFGKKLFFSWSTGWIFNDDKFSMTSGLFSPDVFEVQYYRIKSVRLKRPFLMRFFGLGTIEIITSEQFARTITIPGISEWEWIYNGLQQMSEQARRDRGVGEHNLYNLND
jgi:Predicted membrane protein